MQHLILNLAQDPQRWRRMEEQAERLGLPVRRAEAVLGTDIPPHDLQRLYSTGLNHRQFHRPLVLGEIGCYTSHRRVWRDLLASSEEAFAVFEDDVELSPQLPAALEAISQLPPGWDMIKLVGRRRERPMTSCEIGPGLRLVSYRRAPSLTGAYVISRAGALKLLQHRTPFGRPVDVDLRHWWECDLRLFGLLPYPVKSAPRGSPSTITGRQSVVHTPGGRLKKLHYQLRYAALNWLAVRRHPSPPAAAAASGDRPELQRFLNG